MRFDAPRLSEDVPMLSVTIVNDRRTRSDNPSSQSAAEHDRSLSEHQKRLSTSHESADRRKRRRSSLDRRPSHSTEKSKPLPEKTSRTVESRKKGVSVSAEKDSDDSSDDSSAVVAVQKRLSRAKTVRMYRTVKQKRRQSDDDDDDESNDDKDGDDGGNKTSQPASEATINGILETKTPSSCEEKRSVKSSAVSRRDRGRKAAEALSTSGSSSTNSHKSMRKHTSSVREEKRKLSHSKHSKTKL